MLEIQPSLPGFSLYEVPYKGAEFLRVRKEDGDYYVTLTSAGIQKVTTRQKPCGLSSQAYNRVWTYVEKDEPGLEEFEIGGTRDAMDLFVGGGFDDLAIARDELGLVVLVYVPRLGELYHGSRPFLMTRYDGYSDKIWIRVED